ncbi:hypothetical protein [Phyllobacterium ifriqiyense]|uniref:hypothetical protein n=1 Tax=Phyllobacterium ifriqiyense TaxID=314238 RepID=UPI003392AAA9
MTAFHTTTTDLGQFLTGLIAKPGVAKTVRTNSVAASALRTAWASYREWVIGYEQRQGVPPRRFNRAQFGMYLRNAYLDMRIEKRGPREISLEECLHIAGKR